MASQSIFYYNSDERCQTPQEVGLFISKSWQNVQKFCSRHKIRTAVQLDLSKFAILHYYYSYFTAKTDRLPLRSSRKLASQVGQVPSILPNRQISTGR